MILDFRFWLVVVCVLALCIMFLVQEYRSLKKSYENLQISYRNLEALNSELRGVRHDYQNHVQVVYGLMELEEYEELRNYLEPVYKHMLKTGKALKTSKPAINALIKAKMDEAEGKGIDFYTEVKSDLGRLKVADWELCKILSNLLDNAMTALEGLEQERKITLDISEDKGLYRFSVSNNGPQIPIHMQSEIFKEGISSKKGTGHGMGLYIVSNVLRKYDGKISLFSDEEETEFVFTFTKENSEEMTSK